MTPVKDKIPVMEIKDAHYGMENFANRYCVTRGRGN
jgi:hypothetical protein